MGASRRRSFADWKHSHPARNASGIRPVVRPSAPGWTSKISQRTPVRSVQLRIVMSQAVYVQPGPSSPVFRA
jgi:hypothetical protein